MRREWEARGAWGEGTQVRSPGALTSPLPWAGLLLQEMTMAGLHELRFTEEKPLLRGQDAELVSLVTALAPAPARGVPGRGCLSGSLCVGGVCADTGYTCVPMCWYSVHVCADVCWY
uniref:Uncharacterized protein n=1 Tax=Buteo japonicus TaxID=224669 RepID=A0A8C0AS87_9AVES